MGYLYLTISVLLVTGWALCYSVAVKQKCELRAVNMWLYVGASAVLLLNYLICGPKYNSTAAWLGLITGFGTFFSTLCFFYHMRTGVIAVSWTVIALSVSFPVLASIFIWHEHPTTRQWIGLALIPIAFALCNPAKKEADRE